MYRITLSVRWFQHEKKQRANSSIYMYIMHCQFYWAGILGKPNSSTVMPSYNSNKQSIINYH